MIPGELRINAYSKHDFDVDVRSYTLMFEGILARFPEQACVLQVSEEFTGTIAIGQADLQDHFGVTGPLGGTKRYGAVSSKANSQVISLGHSDILLASNFYPVWLNL